VRRTRRRPTRVTQPGADYEIHVVGEPTTPMRDLYYGVLRLPWWKTIAGISSLFVIVNALFALAYLATGGIAHARPGSFADAFFFSVETMGTIGYGALYPESTGANVVMVVESITSLTLVALVTGLVFAKFSRSTARLVFSRRAVISPVGGVPALMFRIGNQRGNQIIDARIRVVMIRTEKMPEGDTFYRMIDMRLQRERALSLSRSWSVMHPIDRDSPFYGQTPESILAQEVELQILVVGLDDILMQTVHAQHRYYAHQISWGARLVDVLTETDAGNLLLDLTKFHEVEPSRPVDGFPYPREIEGPASG
jgi:inward rectifier potassium channel